MPGEPAGPCEVKAAMVMRCVALARAWQEYEHRIYRPMSIQRFLGGRFQLWGATFVSEGALISLLASRIVIQRHMQPSRHLGYDNCGEDEST